MIEPRTNLGVTTEMNGNIRGCRYSSWSFESSTTGSNFVKRLFGVLLHHSGLTFLYLKSLFDIKIYSHKYKILMKLVILLKTYSFFKIPKTF